MMCYRDMTFCSSDCVETRCRRNFTDEVREGARKWGATFGHEEDPPVSFSDFSGDCPDYKKGPADAP